MIRKIELIKDPEGVLAEEGIWWGSIKGLPEAEIVRDQDVKRENQAQSCPRKKIVVQRRNPGKKSE